MLFWTILYFVSIVLSVAVNPLPKPQSLQWQDSNPIIIDIDKFISTKTNNSIINQAINRTFTSVKSVKYYPYTNESRYNFTNNSTKANPNLQISIQDFNEDLQFGVDESYNITVSPDTIKLDSNTIWGILHGLTTLQQLIVYNNKYYYIEGSVQIQDYPNFPHRGLMIDSARNYLTIDSILEQIDLLSLSKMNTLHWHLVDTQSWPLKLNVYPEMILDAYSPEEIYTHEDISNIINYGKLRGVRIIPEIDSPGHSRAGYRQINENLIECGNEFWSNAGLEPPPGQLNILNNEIYPVIKNIYNEVKDLFPDKSFHVGLDELGKKCYPTDWFNNRSLSDLTQYYLDHTLPIFKNETNLKKLIMWDDILLSDESVSNLDKNITIQLWHDTSGIKNLTSQGYDVIVSLYMHLYLDCGYGGYMTSSDQYTDNPKNNNFNNGKGGSYCAPYKTWQRIYDLDFYANLTDSEKKHVIGAEVTLFGEQVDSTVLTIKIWPRSAALAESTWSGNKYPDGTFRNYDLTQRILNYREYLVKLGYKVSPLTPKYCVMNPHACDLYENPPKII